MTNSATVQRVDGAPATNGVPVANLFASAPRIELRWANAAGWGDLSGDTDNDGLTDWEERYLYATDPTQADTDGDGTSDGQEIQQGAPPLDPDENGDGIPDGMAQADWAADPFWGATAGDTNFVATLSEDIPDGMNASLVFGGLSIPLRHARSFPLFLPAGQMIPFRLFSTGESPVALSIEAAESPDPPWGYTVFSAAPLWLDDPAGVFEGQARFGIGRLAVPILRLIDESGRDFDANECIHGRASPATRTWTVSVLPDGAGLSAPDLTLYGFRLDGPRTISLSVGSTPGESASGAAILEPPALRFGWIGQWRSIHRCEGAWAAYPCEACGFPHSAWNACSHEQACAAVLDDEADCTCSNVFVHVAWRDTDGDGVADKDEADLVESADARAFRTMGDGSEDCCCWNLHVDGYPVAARLVSHSPDLRIFDDSGETMYPGSTSSVFRLQATALSSSVCASHFSYELLDRTNGVLRTLRVPVTSWDIWDTGLAFNWATNSHSADAVNLRHGYATPIDYSQGEWLKPMDHSASPVRDEPACWVAGTWPVVRARFEIRPAGIASATLFAESDGTILRDIPGTAVTFSGGATVAPAGAPHPGYAAFEPMLPIPTVVSRSTNEMLRWHVGSLNGHSILPYVPVAENGPGVAYSILGAPVAPWTDDCLTNQNVWVSALDFVTSTNVCLGATTTITVLEELTRSLFDNFSFVYDTSAGDAHFFGRKTISFRMSDYIHSAMKEPSTMVNCFDQAHGLSFLSSLIGVNTEIMRMEPFGYLNPGHLVGVTNLCNNPFFTSGSVISTTPLCGTNDTSRSKFSCHFFVRHGSSIFDACAGPATGTESVSEYVARMVDISTSGEHFYKIWYRDVFGVLHERTVEGGVPSNAIPYTVIHQIE